VVLYELLTSARPFEGKRLSDMTDTLSDIEPEPLTGTDASISREVESVVLRCLERDPSRRFQTMADLRASLEQAKVQFAKPATTARPFLQFGAWLVLAA